MIDLDVKSRKTSHTTDTPPHYQGNDKKNKGHQTPEQMAASHKTTPVATHHDETRWLLEPVLPGVETADAKTDQSMDGQ